MSNWGREMYVTPGIVLDGKLITTDLVDINLGIRVLLGSSFYDDWQGSEMFVTHDPLGNAIDPCHPWNQTTLPKPQKRDFSKNYSWVMSPALSRVRRDRPDVSGDVQTSRTCLCPLRSRTTRATQAPWNSSPRIQT